MAVTFDLRARPLMVVLLLVVIAAGAGLFVLNRAGDSDDSAAPTTQAAKPTKQAVKKHVTQAPATKPKAPKAAPSPADRLPVGVRRALAAQQAVVVSLHDPKAKIDATALREAKAGADLAGTAFVPVNVNRNVIESLYKRYGAIQDPAVLVLAPTGELVVKIDGFADRDTVAQAALNASR